MRGLILRTSIVQLARRSCDIRFGLIAFLNQDLVLIRPFGLFFCQCGDARLPFEQGV